MGSRFQYIARSGLLIIDNEYVFNMHIVFSLYHSDNKIRFVRPRSSIWADAEIATIRASSEEFQELLEKLKKHD